MKRNFGGLQEELGLALQAALQEPNPVGRYIRCVQAAESAIARMKEQVLADPFPTRDEEIHHFKHEAPEIYSRLFYYLKMVQIEADRPYADEDRFRVLLRQTRDELDTYFRLHDHICRYYNQGQSFQDAHLFLRRPIGQWSGDEIGAYIPPDLTIGTYWVLWIKANDRLRNWLREELAGPHPASAADVKKASKLRWTGQRVDLIEVLCALHLCDCFNNGQATLKEVMKWGEEQLGIKVGQFHVALGEMSLRKDPVPFLKRLSDLLVRKYDSLL
jgi:hypothetical protein